jgi:hypothetical protein
VNWAPKGVIIIMKSDFDVLMEHHRATEQSLARLQAAIREHRDARGDDRCWKDDEELYKMLPEGYTPPERDEAVELKNCERFILNRQNPQTIYESPNVRITRQLADFYEKLPSRLERFGLNAIDGMLEHDPKGNWVRLSILMKFLESFMKELK